MPIFHDDYDPPRRSASPRHDATTPTAADCRPARQELDTARWCTPDVHGAADAVGRSALASAGLSEALAATLSRGELIERIKRVQNQSSTAWPTAWNHGRNAHEISTPISTPTQTATTTPTPTLLPSPDLKEKDGSADEDAQVRDNAITGLQIERPKSALHSGDFRQGRETTDYSSDIKNAPALSTSPVAPWHPSFPLAATRMASRSGFTLGSSCQSTASSSGRSRAASQSTLSSSFVLMPTTSPLVQHTNNADLDFSSKPSSRQASPSPDRVNRRHTFSPHSFQTFRTSNFERGSPASPMARAIPVLRREGAFPYQAHQPRRSLNSTIHMHPYSTPQTPLIRPRRPSLASESSPLQHAPMVGSYEESILRGRMSTTPSRPLNFVAQIGVLGKGQCKTNLRCPPHVTVPFPAVFYSYNSANGKIADDSPSPYVGLVDLENSLPPADDGTENRRRRRHTSRNRDTTTPISSHNPTRESSPDPRNLSRRRLSKMQRRSTSPKSPPGGSYRIPQTGQLQIVIKNPNKTAVKLFLVPYDLSDMEPGTKTFIRQRSYSAGPIIDMPLADRKNYGTDRPEASLSNSEDPNDRPILRYLIHLHICCPSKGRYFLYKAIRVVFANRVPDGKEKLRNEIQLPDPKYSTYKPARDALGPPPNGVNQPLSHTNSSSLSRSEKGFRRRSAGFPLHQSNPYESLNRIMNSSPKPSEDSDSYALRPIPFQLERMATLESRPNSRDHMDIDADSEATLDIGSPLRTRLSASMSMTGLNSPMDTSESSFLDSPGRDITQENHSYDKLNKGDIGYGGQPFGNQACSEGLLTKRLREMDGSSE